MQDAFSSLDEQYGVSQYGSLVYAQDELFWIGYIYRCWAYAYELSSKAVYKICNVKDMHAVYYAYHTMDPLNAVQRLMEAKGIDPDTDCTIEAGVRLLRKIRSELPTAYA